MIKILALFLIIAAGFLIGSLIAGQQGLAFFQVAGYRIRMSMTTFILLELLVFIGLYIVYWLLAKIVGSKTWLGDWFSTRSPKKAIKRIEQAQLLLLEGDYKKAGKLLSKSAKAAHNQTLTYLQAAQAEIDNNQLMSANQLLELAAKSCTLKEKFAFQLVQLRLQIKNREYQTASQLVENLLTQKPRHIEVLRLADQLYRNMAQYQRIIELLPAMYKAHAYQEEQLDQFKRGAYIGLIKQLAESTSSNALIDWWQSQPRAIKNDAIYQRVVAEHLTALGYQNEAEKLQLAIQKKAS